MRNWECPEAVDEDQLKQAIESAIFDCIAKIKSGAATSAYVIIESFLLYALPSLQSLMHRRVFLAVSQFACFKRRYPPQEYLKKNNIFAIIISHSLWICLEP